VPPGQSSHFFQMFLKYFGVAPATKNGPLFDDEVWPVQEQFVMVST
jgi:hypothetical protein